MNELPRPGIPYRDPEFDGIEQTEAYAIVTAKSEVGAGIRLLLSRANIKQADYARRIDKTPAYISKILRGDVNFTIESMVRLIWALGGRLHLKIAPAAEHYEFVPAYPVDLSVGGSKSVSTFVWKGHPALSGMPIVTRQAADNDERNELLAAA